MSAHCAFEDHTLFGPVCKVTPEGCERSADCQYLESVAMKIPNVSFLERDVPIPLFVR